MQNVFSLKNSNFKRIYPWVVVFLLWAVALLNYLDRQIISTMREAIMVDIPELESARNFGRLMAVFLWIYGIAGPFSGAFADRISKKWIIVGSLAIWSSVVLMMGCARNFEELYWFRAAMGLSEALYIPAALALIAEYHTGKTRALAIGIHMTGIYIGQVIGGFGALVAAGLSWQGTFHFMGIAGVAYAVVLAVLLRDPRKNLQPSADAPALRVSPKTSESVVKSFAMLFSNAAFWVILFYFSTISLPGWAAKNWLPTIYTQSLDLPMTQAGPTATFALAMSSLIGVIFGGWLSDRWVKKTLRGRSYTVSCGITLCIIGLCLLGFGSGVVAAILAGIFFGFGFGMVDANNMPLICQFIPDKRRSAAYGFMNMTGLFAGALITDFLGKMTEEGHVNECFVILALIMLFTVILQFFALHPRTDNCG